MDKLQMDNYQTYILTDIKMMETKHFSLTFCKDHDVINNDIYFYKKTLFLQRLLFQKFSKIIIYVNIYEFDRLVHT